MARGRRAWNRSTEASDSRHTMGVCKRHCSTGIAQACRGRVAPGRRLEQARQSAGSTAVRVDGDITGRIELGIGPTAPTSGASALSLQAALPPLLGSTRKSVEFLILPVRDPLRHPPAAVSPVKFDNTCITFFLPFMLIVCELGTRLAGGQHIWMRDRRSGGCPAITTPASR